MTIALERYKALYETMLRIRRFEEAASRLMAEGRLPGFLHLSIGQEAVAAGVCGSLRADDHIATTHRGHGHCIAKGGGVGRMMAELFGRENGYCRGRSGSMHIADPAVGILGANAIVGGGLPMALGAAWSALARGTDQVAVVFFGEGAVAEGVFHECMNLASLWKLPLVFVCENNQYAELSHVSLHLSSPDVASFGDPYGVKSESLDGNDVAVVAEAAETAVSRARVGGGPALLECRTYRWHGHFEGDPQRYRTQEEVAEWQTRDPLEAARSHLRSGGIDDDELRALDAAIRDEIETAVERAQSAEPVSAAILTEDTYRNPPGQVPAGSER